jgi:hypothetical protein
MRSSHHFSIALSLAATPFFLGLAACHDSSSGSSTPVEPTSGDAEASQVQTLGLVALQDEHSGATQALGLAAVRDGHLVVLFPDASAVHGR